MHLFKKKNNNILDKITICILSANREEDLKKKILFYKKKKIRLIILDQSLSSIKKFCDINLNKNSYYFHYPNFNYLRRVILIKNYLKTKYCMIQTDDDLFSLNSIVKSLLFLEKNNDYVSVSGKVFSVNIFKKKFYFKEIFKSSRTIKFNDSFIRLKSMLNFSFFNIYYGISRTKFLLNHIKILKNNYKIYGENLHRFHDLQYLIILSLTGKIKIINNIFYLRSGHNKRLPLPSSSNDNLTVIINLLKIGKLDKFIKNILKNFKKNTSNNQKLLKNYIYKEYYRRYKEKFIGISSLINNKQNFIFRLIKKLLYSDLRKFISFFFGRYGKSFDSLPYPTQKEIQRELTLNKFLSK